jgi:ferredoxin
VAVGRRNWVEEGAGRLFPARAGLDDEGTPPKLRVCCCIVVSRLVRVGGQRERDKVETNRAGRTVVRTCLSSPWHLEGRCDAFYSTCKQIEYMGKA